MLLKTDPSFKELSLDDPALRELAQNKPQTILRVTGSNQILMNQNVKESLAGRASYFDMNTLSVSEILASQKKSIQEILSSVSSRGGGIY